MAKIHIIIFTKLVRLFLTRYWEFHDFKSLKFVKFMKHCPMKKGVGTVYKLFNLRTFEFTDKKHIHIVY